MGPETRSGTFAVELTVVLLCSLGLKKIVLEDEATLDPGASLLFIRIFQGKFSSWYESFGFEPEHSVLDGEETDPEEPVIDKAEFLRLANSLYSFPLSRGKLGETMIRIWSFDKNAYGSMFGVLKQHPTIGPLIKKIELFKDRSRYVKMCRR